MTKVIALFNMSGGVGKSTLTMNLGYHLNENLNHRVLLIDMDPQASLTTFLGLAPFELEKSVYHSIIKREPLVVIPDILGCDVVPSNIYLAQAELELASELRREYRLADAITQRQAQYDIVLVDCPPSLGLLSVNCLVASDYLAIPIQTEYKSVEATINLLQTTYEIAQQVNPTLKVAGAIPTMFDERTSQSKRALQTIQEVFDEIQTNPSFKDATVYPPIPRRTDFANAVAEHQALAQYSPKQKAREVLEDIAQSLGRLP